MISSGSVPTRRKRWSTLQGYRPVQEVNMLSFIVLGLCLLLTASVACVLLTTLANTGYLDASAIPTGQIALILFLLLLTRLMGPSKDDPSLLSGSQIFSITRMMF